MTVSNLFKTDVSITSGTGTASTVAIGPTGDTNTGLFFPAADTIAFSEGGTEAMRIDSSGRVGIGTDNPTRKLTISASGAAFPSASNPCIRMNETSSERFGVIEFDSDTNLNIWGSDVGSGSIRFFRGTGSGTESLRIDSSGKLLLNTTSAANYIFNAIAKTTQGGLFKTEGLGARDAFPLACWHNATTGDNLFVDFNTETSITSRGYIDYNRASGLVRYGTTSDATLKNIIGDTSGDESLNILRNTKIRDFTWKEDASGKVNVGVIAQELYGVFKGAVSVGGEYQTKDENGNDVTKYRPWAVDKTAFSFHLVAGWQAHEKLIQELKSENDSLKARVAALEAA